MLAVLLLAAGLGAAGALYPLPTIVAMAALTWLGFILVNSHRLSSVFFLALGLLLIGYAFLGRGVAHVGVAPLYIGEAVLSFTVVALLVGLRRARFGLLEVTLIGFMAWGLLRTIPFVSHYGVDALRDAVIWAYAVVALSVAFLIERKHFDTIIHWYGRLLPIFIGWVPIAVGIWLAFGMGFPSAPGSEVPLVAPKGGDLGVHLAGAASFLLLGLMAHRSRGPLSRNLLIWPLWIIGVILVSALNRGGLMAVAIGVGFAFMLRPSARILTLFFTGALMLSSFILINPSIDLGARELSVNQMTANIRSIFSDTEQGHLEGTRQWRLRWWGDIVDYTVYGPYRWTGKGFGVNLADVDGYQANADGSIRSPHNGHLTVLARMGVPGMALWITLHLGFALAMLRAVFRMRARGDIYWMNLNIWILTYWLAMMVNAGFDVYLEGPQGGIWFWAVLGLGLGAMRLQRTRPDETAADETYSTMTQEGRNHVGYARPSIHGASAQSAHDPRPIRSNWRRGGDSQIGVCPTGIARSRGNSAYSAKQ